MGNAHHNHTLTVFVPFLAHLLLREETTTPQHQLSLRHWLLVLPKERMSVTFPSSNSKYMYERYIINFFDPHNHYCFAIARTRQYIAVGAKRVKFLHCNERVLSVTRTCQNQRKVIRQILPSRDVRRVLTITCYQLHLRYHYGLREPSWIHNRPILGQKARSRYCLDAELPWHYPRLYHNSGKVYG